MIDCKSSFAYNGQDFTLVGEDTAAQVAGSAVVLWNTRTGEKDYLWSKRNGYCVACANYNNGFIAAAEYGLNPEVHIYRYPTKELVYKFGMDTTVKCIGMTFSRDGRYLLMIGGVPDFRISIFDVENNKKLVIPETKLPCKPEEFVGAKFNPSNKSNFAILSQTCLYNYTIHQAYDVTERGENKILGESFRLESSEFRDEDPDNLRPDLTFTKFLWDAHGRVHICTDYKLLYQVNPKENKLEHQVELTSRPVCALLTQKHMIVSLEEGIILWLKLELPEVGIGDKDGADQCVKVLDEIEQEYTITLKVGESDVPEHIAHMHYTRGFKQLIMGTTTGVFGRLEVEAEAINYDEEEEDAQNQKEKKIITTPFQELGRFHTKRVTGIRELGETTQVITISEDHYMSIWEATSQQLLSTVFQPAHPTALDVSADGTTAFVGTAVGAFRVYDLTDRTNPRLALQQRLFDEEIPITTLQSSLDGRFVLLGSSGSKTVFVLSQSAEDKFRLNAYIDFEGYVLSAAFATQNKQLQIVTLLSNNLLAGCNVPTKPAANRLTALSEEEADIKYRKVDRGSEMVIANQVNGDIFVTGEDKLLKKYQYPYERVGAMDYKRAPQPPDEEHFSHSVGTCCWDIAKDFKYMITGGKDGTVFVKHVDNIGSAPTPIKAHAVFSGGVTALCLSRTRTVFYSAGGDGSFMAWCYGGKPNPPQPVNAALGANPALQRMPTVQRVPVSEIKVYRELLLEEFHASQEQRKQEFKQERMLELNQIKDKLFGLLADNERVTDIERLERDEFVIDTSRRDKIFDEGESECEEIRREAERTVLRLELLRNRVKQSTWDTMTVQQKAIKSIQSDTLIFNYPIRKRTPKEQRRLEQVSNIRKLELLDKLHRQENKLKECLDEEEFSRSTESYLMNRAQGHPLFEEDGSIADAAKEFLEKEAEKKKKRDKQELNLTNQQSTQPGKKQPLLKITKGKLGSKTKKKDIDDDPGKAAKDKMQQREIRGMEEMHWRVRFELKALEEIKANLAECSIFDLIYEPYELHTDIRKRNQIELIKGVVFQLKEDFNEEFKELESFKEEQLANIKDKNDQITEILYNLGQEEDLFQPTTHPLEDPTAILQITPDEVKVEKYLTKEERRLEELRLKEEAEREAALKGDNVGRRGLKSMMGSTELNLKKDKGALDEDMMLPEELASKHVDEYNDDEKQKYKEWEQKKKETMEKRKKAWEQELKKIKSDIIDTQLRFEERLLTSFKKKLFVDVRILEQELYLIRLVIMLHDGKETRLDQRKYQDELQKLEGEKAEKEELIGTFRGFAQDLEARLSDDSTIREQEKELKKMFPDANYKQIMAFVRTGKAKKAPLPGEVNPREVELSRGIVDLDPFAGVDKSRVKEILKEEDDREHYDYDRDNVAGLNEDDFERLVQERQSRAEMDKDKEKLQNQISQLQSHIDFLEDQLREVEEKYDGQVAAERKASDRIRKIRYDFETVVYLRQGQIEVPQLPVATDYKDAILVQKEVIDFENKEIKKRGDEKVKLMKAISDFKTGLKRVRYIKKRLDLEIKDFEERAKDVQLYRVTKQTQEIIQGKHQKKDEEDKKRLENQIKQLEENAQKRIKTINETRLKLKKEIKEKKMESEQLETKARHLQTSVEQRKQIMSLKSNTMTDGDADPSKKIKEIAHKRKLLDIAKQQTEEIEVLRDELDRLRARTFPSFAHLHNKPGYPDEN